MLKFKIFLAVVVLTVMGYQNAFAQRLDVERCKSRTLKIVRKINTFLATKGLGDFVIGEKIVEVRTDFDGSTLTIVTKSDGPNPFSEEELPTIAEFRFWESEPEAIGFVVPSLSMIPNSRYLSMPTLTADQMVERITELYSALGDVNDVIIHRVLIDNFTASIAFSLANDIFIYIPGASMEFNTVTGLPCQFGFSIDEKPFVRKDLLPRISEAQARSMALRMIQSNRDVQSLRNVSIIGPVSDSKTHEKIEFQKEDRIEAYYIELGRMHLEWSGPKRDDYGTISWIGYYQINSIGQKRQPESDGDLGIISISINAVSGEIGHFRVTLFDKPYRYAGWGASETKQDKSIPFSWYQCKDVNAVAINGKRYQVDLNNMQPIESPVTGKVVPIMLFGKNRMLMADYDTLSETLSVTCNGKKHFARPSSEFVRQVSKALRS